MNTPVAPAIPMSPSLALGSDQGERARQIDIFKDTLQRKYSLAVDDPTFILLDLFRYHEDFILVTRDSMKADYQEFLNRFQAMIGDAVKNHEGFGKGVSTAIDALKTEREAYLKRADVDEGDRARFAAMVESVLTGFKTFQQNLVDTNKLQINLEAACQVLTKRAMIESILNYMLPLIGFLVGAASLLFLLLRFGWLVQS